MITSSGIKAAAVLRISEAVTLVFKEPDVWQTPPTPAAVHTRGTFTSPVPDKAVSVCTPPTSPSLMKNPVNAFWPVIVKVVPTLTVKVEGDASVSVVAPSFTENPPVASEPVIILCAFKWGPPSIAASPAAQLPVALENACDGCHWIAAITRILKKVWDILRFMRSRRDNPSTRIHCLLWASHSCASLFCTRQGQYESRTYGRDIFHFSINPFILEFHAKGNHITQRSSASTNILNMEENKESLFSLELNSAILGHIREWISVHIFNSIHSFHVLTTFVFLFPHVNQCSSST